MSNKNIVPDQKVKLRKRKLPSGNVALFLDYVQNETRMRENLGAKTLFLQYYRDMFEERHGNPDTQGNWGNWLPPSL